MLKCFVAVSYFMVVFLEALSRINFMPAIIQKTYWHCKVHLNFSEWEYIVKKKGHQSFFSTTLLCIDNMNKPRKQDFKFFTRWNELNDFVCYTTVKIREKTNSEGGSSNGECSDHFSLHALIENCKNLKKQRNVNKIIILLIIDENCDRKFYLVIFYVNNDGIKKN